MTTRAEWHQATSTAEAFARSRGRAVHNARRREAADSQARAIVARLQMIGPVRGAQSQVAREQGVSFSTVSRALLRASASTLGPLDAVVPHPGPVFETMPSTNGSIVEASEARKVTAKSARAALRTALGITVQPAPPRRFTKAQKAQRKAQLLVEVLARWATDTRTKAEWMADAHIVIPTPAEQHAEGKEMLAIQERAAEQWNADQRRHEQRRHELDLDARALLADVRSDP